MADTAPGHVCDVEQPVDAAEVDKCSVIRDVLHHALNQLPFLQRGQGCLPFRIPRLFQEHTPGYDDVAAPMIDLDNLERECPPDQPVKIPHRMKIDLRARQERLHTDIDHHAAFDPRHNFAVDAFAVIEELFQLLPNLHLVGFFFGENQIAVGVFTLLDIYLKPITHLDVLKLLGGELIVRDHPFGLVADVHDHLVFGHGDDATLCYGAFFEVLECLLVQGC